LVIFFISSIILANEFPSNRFYHKDRTTGLTLIQ